VKKGIEKSAKSSTGLPVDVIKDLQPHHYSFYVQNKDRMTIRRSTFNNFEYTVDGEKFYNEHQFDSYLDRINFRRSNACKESGCVSSKEIDKQLDKMLGN